MSKFFILAMFVVSASITGIYGCHSGNNQQKETSDAKKKSASIQQDEEDLLAGTHRAVCYSGFRSGQHPDRGDGAVLPSDEEILEDLTILSEDSLFNLIRLYDSQENSASVLRIIKEHDLPIKVMLGIWLKAELSNHEGCAWLNEPIPQEVLDQNMV
ncbi:hypothetical protein, partial [Marinilabilia sp.]